MNNLLGGIVLTLGVFTQIAGCASLPGGQGSNCGDIGYSNFNKDRVDAFFSEYGTTTFKRSDSKRAKVLDERLKEAHLTLADKIEVLKRLSPPNNPTGDSKETRLTQLILSVSPTELAPLKYTVDYDGDYKDMEEYVFHDVDEQDRQKALVAHFAKDSATNGVKVLTDVDDTMYANLVDNRYPKGTFYPGVLAFYAALGKEPFHTSATPITTLSARPNPVGGSLEEGSIGGLTAKSGQALCPTALSGETFSSLIGTTQTLIRVNSPTTGTETDHDQENEIGRVKFANFAAYSQIYPDYNFVFVGDSGQADTITAASMVTDTEVAGTDRVLTTFIHDLRTSQQDTTLASHSFRQLDDRLKVTKTSRNPKGVIVFRNYIAAATVAYAHGDKLGNLITTEELGNVVASALTELADIKFVAGEQDKERMFREYREDAKTAIAVLESRNSPDSTLAKQKIERALAGM